MSSIPVVGSVAMLVLCGQASLFVCSLQCGGPRAVLADQGLPSMTGLGRQQTTTGVDSGGVLLHVIEEQSRFFSVDFEASLFCSILVCIVIGPGQRKST